MAYDDWCSIDPYNSALHMRKTLSVFLDRKITPYRLLIGDATVRLNTPYPPAPGLRFGNNCWQAYFHLHRMPSFGTGPVGHFHIFARSGTGSQDCTQLAGLVMDRNFQPVKFFAGNHWATRDVWRSRAQIYDQLSPPALEADSLLGRWLCGLVHLFAVDLDHLLRARDHRLDHLQKVNPDKERDQILNDRNYSVLASIPINLAQRMHHLLHNHGADALHKAVF